MRAEDNGGVRNAVLAVGSSPSTLASVRSASRTAAQRNDRAAIRRRAILTESEKASDSKGRGRGPVRISYRLRFRHRQRGLIWISGHQTAVNRDFRLLSRDL